MNAPRLDEIDHKLLALLQANGQHTVAELSQATGVAASTLNDRIKRLSRLGVVTGYHARVDPEALGLELLAFVFVGWSDPEVEQVFLAAIASAPQVLECHHVTGAWNYLLKVRVPTTRMLEAFLGGVLKGVDGLQRTETLIVLSTAKETWQLEQRSE